MLQKQKHTKRTCRSNIQQWQNTTLELYITGEMWQGQIVDAEEIVTGLTLQCKCVLILLDHTRHKFCRNYFCFCNLVDRVQIARLNEKLHGQMFAGMQCPITTTPSVNMPLHHVPKTWPPVSALYGYRFPKEMLHGSYLQNSDTHWYLRLKKISMSIKLYMTDFFLFAQLNLPNVLISVAKKFFL